MTESARSEVRSDSKSEIKTFFSRLVLPYGFWERASWATQLYLVKALAERLGKNPRDLNTADFNRKVFEVQGTAKRKSLHGFFQFYLRELTRKRQGTADYSEGLRTLLRVLGIKREASKPSSFEAVRRIFVSGAFRPPGFWEQMSKETHLKFVKELATHLNKEVGALVPGDFQKPVFEGEGSNPKKALRGLLGSYRRKSPSKERTGPMTPVEALKVLKGDLGIRDVAVYFRGSRKAPFWKEKSYDPELIHEVVSEWNPGDEVTQVELTDQQKRFLFEQVRDGNFAAVEALRAIHYRAVLFYTQEIENPSERRDIREILNDSLREWVKDYAMREFDLAPRERSSRALKEDQERRITFSTYIVPRIITRRNEEFKRLKKRRTVSLDAPAYRGEEKGPSAATAKAAIPDDVELDSPRDGESMLKEIERIYRESWTGRGDKNLERNLRIFRLKAEGQSSRSIGGRPEINLTAEAVRLALAKVRRIVQNRLKDPTSLRAEVRSETSKPKGLSPDDFVDLRPLDRGALRRLVYHFRSELDEETYRRMTPERITTELNTYLEELSSRKARPIRRRFTDLQHLQWKIEGERVTAVGIQKALTALLKELEEVLEEIERPDMETFKLFQESLRGVEEPREQVVLVLLTASGRKMVFQGEILEADQDGAHIRLRLSKGLSQRTRWARIENPDLPLERRRRSDIPTFRIANFFRLIPQESFDEKGLRPNSRAEVRSDERKFFFELLDLLNKNGWLDQPTDKIAFDFLGDDPPEEATVLSWPHDTYLTKKKWLTDILNDRIRRGYLAKMGGDQYRLYELSEAVGIEMDRQAISDFLSWPESAFEEVRQGRDPFIEARKGLKNWLMNELHHRTEWADPLWEIFRAQDPLNQSIWRLGEAFFWTARHLFIPPRLENPFAAYEDRGWHIGFGQPNSQPIIMAFMLAALDVWEGLRVFEGGSGTGFFAGMLGFLAGSGAVHTVERIPYLAYHAERTLKRIGRPNVKVHVGDAYRGLPEFSPFDRMVISAGVGGIPWKLVEQLSPRGGRMVIPIHSPGSNEKGNDYDITLVVRENDQIIPARLSPSIWVPLVPSPRAEVREKLSEFVSSDVRPSKRRQLGKGVLPSESRQTEQDYSPSPLSLGFRGGQIAQPALKISTMKLPSASLKPRGTSLEIHRDTEETPERRLAIWNNARATSSLLKGSNIADKIVETPPAVNDKNEIYFNQISSVTRAEVREETSVQRQALSDKGTTPPTAYRLSLTAVGTQLKTTLELAREFPERAAIVYDARTVLPAAEEIRWLKRNPLAKIVIRWPEGLSVNEKMERLRKAGIEEELFSNGRTGPGKIEFNLNSRDSVGAASVNGTDPARVVVVTRDAQRFESRYSTLYAGNLRNPAPAALLLAMAGGREKVYKLPELFSLRPNGQVFVTPEGAALFNSFFLEMAAELATVQSA